MVLKQMVLVIKTDSGTYSNTFLTKPSLLRRTVRETIMEYLPWRTLLFTMRTLHSCSKIWNASSTFILQFNHKFLACKKKLRVWHIPFGAMLCAAEMNTQASRRAAWTYFFQITNSYIISKSSDKTENELGGQKP